MEALQISMGKLGTLRTGRSIPDLPAEGEQVQAEVAGMQVMQTFRALKTFCHPILACLQMHPECCYTLATVKGPRAVMLVIQ